MITRKVRAGELHDHAARIVQRDITRGSLSRAGVRVRQHLSPNTMTLASANAPTTTWATVSVNIGSSG